MKSFDLSDLEVEVNRVESFQSDFEKKSGGTPALAATLWVMASAEEETGKAARPAEGKRKGNVMRVDVAILTENIQTSLSSSSSSRNNHSLSLGISSCSSNIQYSNNHSRSSNIATGVDHSSTGAHCRIIYTGVIRECVMDVEGQGISTRNAGRLLHVLPTSQLFRVNTSCTTAISLPLHYRTCKLH